jgi:dTMP kinase
VTALRFYGDRPPGVEGDELPGRLIVLEGTDGVGRSTHVRLLTEWLEARGYAVVNTGLRRSQLAARGIERAMRGNTLDALTLNLLYATDFWDRLERQILPALRAGMVALVDRYVFSLMSRAIVRGLSREWLDNLFAFALVPDLVIYLDIDVEHLIPRVLEGKGMDYWESGMHLALGDDIFDSFTRYQTQLIGEYNRLARQHRFTSVDARKSIDEIQGELRANISAYLQRSSEAKARRRRAERLVGVRQG